MRFLAYTLTLVMAAYVSFPVRIVAMDGESQSKRDNPDPHHGMELESASKKAYFEEADVEKIAPTPPCCEVAMGDSEGRSSATVATSRGKASINTRLMSWCSICFQGLV